MADDETRAQVEIDPAIGTVEVKIAVRARDEDEVVEALERADSEPEVRDVYFFDTTELTLFDAGIVLRARLVHDGADDSTVKLPSGRPELDRQALDGTTRSLSSRLTRSATTT